MMKYQIPLLLASFVLAACTSNPSGPADGGTPTATAIDSLGANPNPSPANVGTQFSWTVFGQDLTCKLDVEGDGQVDYTVEGCTSQSRVLHMYGLQGSFDAKLTVTGGDGVTREQTTAVTVAAPNTPPAIPSLTPAPPPSATDALAVRFTWVVSDFDADITRCRFDAESDGVWDFDDLCSGLPANTSVGKASSVTFSYTHKYSKKGRYEATLEAADPYISTRAKVPVRVPWNRAPVIDTLKSTVGANNTATVLFAVSDPDDDTLTCTLKVEAVGTFRYTDCRELSRVFSGFEPGSYAISLSVSDGLETMIKSITLVISGGEEYIPIPYLNLGENSTCLTMSNTEAYCWGGNWAGQLSDGTTTDRHLPNRTTPPPGAYPYSQMDVGYEMGCALNELGKAYCWGFNQFGSIGDGTDQNNRLTPVAVVMPIASFTHLSVGADLVCGIGDNLKTYCWGYNGTGAVGDGTNIQRKVPTEVLLPTAPGLTQFTHVSAGSGHTCAQGNDLKTYCWGKNDSGQVGDDSTDSRNRPVAVSLPTGVLFTQIVAGYEHTCALGDDNKAYCWGDNAFGQLGDNSTNNRDVPTEVILPSVAGLTAFVQISPGRDLTCALGDDGKAYCWGHNNKGELGNDSFTDSRVAVPVTMPTDPGFSKFVKISSGHYHVCAIGNNASIYCWGSNNNGEIGNDSTTNVKVPALITLP